jgi:hypothetical protein
MLQVNFVGDSGFTIDFRDQRIFSILLSFCYN